MFDYNRMHKKGSYNFHRPSNNNVMHNSAYPNDSYRNVDNVKAQENVEPVKDAANFDVADKNENPQVSNRPDMVETTKPKDDLDDACNTVDFDVKKGDKIVEKKRAEPYTQPKNDETRKYNEKPTGNKKKMKAEAATASTVAKEPPAEADEEGFTKVRYRGHHALKKHKNADHHNENVNWIVPGRENKE